MIYLSDLKDKIESIKEYNSYCFGAILKFEREIKAIFDLRDELVDKVENLIDDIDEDMDTILRTSEFTMKNIVPLFEDDLEDMQSEIEELIEVLSDDEEDYAYEFEYRAAQDLKDDLEKVQDLLLIDEIVEDGYDTLYEIFDNVEKLLDNH